MLAPSVQIYSATHSVDAAERKAAWRRAYTVDIGDDVSPRPESAEQQLESWLADVWYFKVWIGGGAIIIGPCAIGKNSTVAAGAVVRGTFPENV